MDRNDRIKQKYHIQKSFNPKRDVMRASENFDPDPYVDVILDNMAEEMEYNKDGLEDFLLNLTENPKLEIIFGKASVLNKAQKSMVIEHLRYRVKAVRELDSTPYVDELVTLFNNRDFDQFKNYDDDGDVFYDFSDYFEDQNFTREQLDLIEAKFYERQKATSKKFSWRLFFPTIISILTVIILPFFIPNFMQRLGLLSLNAGWFAKIGVGVVSLAILFFLMKKLLLMYVIKVLKAKKITKED